jgi:acetate kinase
MAKILVINCGSSSLKYEVYEMPEKKSLGKGLVERIGDATGKITQESPKGVYTEETPIPDHRRAMELVSKALTDSTAGIIGSIGEIAAAGHRVVHGGEYYAESVLIDDKVIEIIDKVSELAPLHNPPNLTGIRETINLLGNKPQVAVFDTAFHQTLPPAAYLYGIPRELYDKYRIRRYGFHGTSHRYVAGEALNILKRSVENTNIISCHLGNGASITAVKQGKSIDTSMGFTPLEGLVMGTRSGDIDPAVLLYLLKRGYTGDALDGLLNKKSGMLGLSGISNDMRDIEKAAKEGNKNAQEALDVYAYRIRKYIGAYAANLTKTDALIFTGGIGQNSISTRAQICQSLEALGIFLDPQKNAEVGRKTGIISADFSPTAIAVIITNEELQIAMDSYDIALKK